MNKLEKLVLQSIGENVSSPDVFLDTDDGLEPIRDSINSAIEEIAMLTGVYRERYLIPLYSGQGFYRLKFTRGEYAYVLNCYSMNEKRRLYQDGLQGLEANGYRWMTQTGSPHTYVQFGYNVIGFYPRPSGTEDMIEVECAVIPQRYQTSTDRIKLKKDFEKTVVHLAVSEYWASRGDASEAKKHLETYTKSVSLDMSVPTNDFPRLRGHDGLADPIKTD